MSKEFENKVILVTGGGGGMGNEISLAFARAGARVAVADIRADTTAGTVRRIEDEGGTAIGVEVDVGDSPSVQAMVRRATEELGTPMLLAAIEQRGGNEAETARRLTVTGRLGEPREVAQAALWLCSDQASFTLGHVLAVDGGYLAT